ncbi:MAG: hypothetical protein LBB51_04910 [Zoogloeaceae bacterium]|jgi:hypothetical protein|nr:hypothetical protein [Zoogloeaceae bacterium]
MILPQASPFRLFECASKSETLLVADGLGLKAGKAHLQTAQKQRETSPSLGLCCPFPTVGASAPRPFCIPCACNAPMRPAFLLSEPAQGQRPQDSRKTGLAQQNATFPYKEQGFTFLTYFDIYQ